MGGESRPMRSGDGFDAGVLNRRGILGPGLLPPISDGDRFLARVGAGGGGGGSPWPMPLSGLVLQLAAESPPRGEAPSVLRRRLSSSVEANDMRRSKPLLILSCHLSTLRSPTSSSSPSSSLSSVCLRSDGSSIGGTGVDFPEFNSGDEMALMASGWLAFDTTADTEDTPPSVSPCVMPVSKSCFLCERVGGWITGDARFKLPFW